MVTKDGIRFQVKRDLSPEQLKNARRIMGIEDDETIDKHNDGAKSGKVSVGSKKIIISLFTLAYLIILFFTPVTVPKLGVRFVPFYTIGNRVNEYYSQGVGYINSYVRELNIQILIIEIIIVSVLFAWSLYFFNKKNNNTVEK